MNNSNKNSKKKNKTRGNDYIDSQTYQNNILNLSDMNSLAKKLRNNNSFTISNNKKLRKLLNVVDDSDSNDLKHNDMLTINNKKKIINYLDDANPECSNLQIIDNTLTNKSFFINNHQYDNYICERDYESDDDTQNGNIINTSIHKNYDKTMNVTNRQITEKIYKSLIYDEKLKAEDVNNEDEKVYIIENVSDDNSIEFYENINTNFTTITNKLKSYIENDYTILDDPLLVRIFEKILLSIINDWNVEKIQFWEINNILAWKNDILLNFTAQYEVIINELILQHICNYISDKWIPAKEYLIIKNIFDYAVQISHQKNCTKKVIADKSIVKILLSMSQIVPSFDDKILTSAVNQIYNTYIYTYDEYIELLPIYNIDQHTFMLDSIVAIFKHIFTKSNTNDLSVFIKSYKKWEPLLSYENNKSLINNLTSAVNNWIEKNNKNFDVLPIKLLSLLESLPTDSKVNINMQNFYQSVAICYENYIEELHKSLENNQTTHIIECFIFWKKVRKLFFPTLTTYENHVRKMLKQYAHNE